MHQSPEQIFKHFCGPILAYDRVDLFGALPIPKCLSLPWQQARPLQISRKGIGVAIWSEKHGNQLCPTGEAFGPPLRLMLCYYFSKFGPGESDEAVDLSKLATFIMTMPSAEVW